MEGLNDGSITHIKRDLLVVQEESEAGQQDTGDCLSPGFQSTLHESVHLSFAQNNLSDLQTIWGKWEPSKKVEFTKRYGAIALLLSVKVDLVFLRAIMNFWDPSYRCFTFNHEDLTPTIEEYSTLLRIPSAYKIFSKKTNHASVLKRLAKIMGLSSLPVSSVVKKKGEDDGIPWEFLHEYIKNHPEEPQAIDVFALAIYGLVIFPKILGHVEVSVIEIFERLGTQVDPVPAILAETIRSLNFCRRKKRTNGGLCATFIHLGPKSLLGGKQCEVSYIQRGFLPHSRVLSSELVSRLG